MRLQALFRQHKARQKRATEVEEQPMDIQADNEGSVSTTGKDFFYDKLLLFLLILFAIKFYFV